MKLYVKNMVCSRCKMVVKDELIKFRLHPISVELGEVEIREDLNLKKKEFRVCCYINKKISINS